MAKPQEADPGVPRHRPLPSVDMALLPHELRAVRLRQATLAVLSLLLLGGALALTIARPWIAALVDREPGPSEAPWPGERPGPSPSLNPNTASTPVVAAASAKPAPSVDTDPSANQVEPLAAAPAIDSTDPAQPPAPLVRWPIVPVQDAEGASTPSPAAVAAEPGTPIPTAGRSVRPFGQSYGFRAALVAAGISSADADGLIAALTKLVDFRRAQPEDELVLERDATGQLQAFEFRASLTERYRAERKPQGAGWKAARVKVEIEHRRISKGGYLSDSLGKALEGLGMKSNIAGVFVEAFEGRIDFKKQARQGDSFKLVMEEERVEGQLLGNSKIHALQYTSARAGELTAFWFESDTLGGDFYDENGRALHGGWLRTPLRYDHISSRYNLKRRHPILKRVMPHEGIDYSAPPGTPVWAAADGVVTFAGTRGPNGNLIALSHSGGYESFYAHLLHTAHGIARGTKVKQRQMIGSVGSTGRSTGPHLHFALKRNGKLIDPATQLNGPGKPLPEAQLPRFKRAVSQLKHELAGITLAAAPAPAGSEPESGEDFHEDAIDL